MCFVVSFVSGDTVTLHLSMPGHSAQQLVKVTHYSKELDFGIQMSLVWVHLFNHTNKWRNLSFWQAYSWSGGVSF